MIKDSLLDILKHTKDLGFIELVKLVGSEDAIEIEAMHDAKTVVLNARLNDPIDGIDSTVGLSRLGVLKGYLEFKAFSSDNATIAVTRNSKDNPVEISFNSNDGNKSSYRFMGESMVQEQIRVPPFKGAKWDVVIEPDSLAIENLSYMNSVLGAFEATFLARTVDDNLEFHIGSNANDTTKITFAKDIDGALSHGWRWPLSEVLTILKLQSACKSCKMYFSNQGALKISIESGLGMYDYILPARAE